MRQLGELNKNADKFKEMNVEVIAIFRKEAEGIEGLQKVRDKTKVEFTLGLDTPAEKTASYSPGRREFSSYVIDSKGSIQGIIKGSLMKRANSEQLMEILASLNKGE